jgi:hypothetical protein
MFFVWARIWDDISGSFHVPSDDGRLLGDDALEAKCLRVQSLWEKHAPVTIVVTRVEPTYKGDTEAIRT